MLPRDTVLKTPYLEQKEGVVRLLLHHVHALALSFLCSYELCNCF